MKKITYKDYWFTRNFFNVLSIPLTLLAIVVSLNADVIDQELNFKPHDLTLKKFSSLINFFDNQSKLFDTISIQKIRIKDVNPKYYNHLLILDRTSSTIFTNSNEQAKKLHDTLYFKIKEKLKVNYDISTNEMIIWHVYLKILDLNSISYLCPTYYDGDIQGLKPIDLNNKIINSSSNWFPCIEESSKELLINSLENTLVISFKDQSTDFNNIFSGISRYAKKNMIVTIISDFYHENESISKNRIDFLQTQYDIHQLNLIYFPPKDLSKREKSFKLISLLQNNFEKTLNYHELNLDDFSDLKFNNESFNDFNIQTIQCLSPYSDSIENELFLFHPKYDKKKLTKAICLIKGLSYDSISKVKWRISSAFPSLNKENVIGTYKLEHENGKCGFIQDGNWQPFPQEGYTLELDFQVIPNLDFTNLYFDVFNGEVTTRYKISYKKLMPQITANLGKSSIILIILLLYGLILNHFWHTINILRQSIKIPKEYFIRALFFIFLSILFFCCSFIIRFSDFIKYFVGLIVILHIIILIKSYIRK
jgi:hypothetical protein